ncbi:MAG TPA: AsmA family protein [Candidatus Baltobacteraceae bacterium]|nr:AsmA family protein [Candidatus Baltobacteraceae bacterium]
MSGAYAHTVEPPEPLESAPPPRRVWTLWLKWLAILVAFLWLASLAISLLIGHTLLQRKFTQHLETAFGRPVEVGSYRFSFWGPSLEANSVRVADDERFGHEYFLYADSLSVRLRWLSLLRGHIELGTLSLSHPSLNLVRDSAGDWNLAEWLPRPGENGSPRVPVGPSLPSSALRFRKIEIDGGRINFKQGDEKLPFAFVDVSGSVETDSPGLWRIDLDATPWRAAILLQQVGTIHVAGHVGGTSSRMRPAALAFSWSDASISDVLRLATGDDYGIRGGLAIALNATTSQDPADTWSLQGRAQLAKLHRWDLASRPDNPSVNLIAQALWRPTDSFVEFSDASFEAPNSNLHANGRISWLRPDPRKPPKETAPGTLILVTPSQVDFSDLLDWLRAFHPGVADTIVARGSLVLNGEAGGWPLRVVNATAFSEGADLLGPSLQAATHVAHFEFRYDRGVVSLPPATLSFIAPSRASTARSAAPAPALPSDGSFQVSVLTKPAHGALPAWHVAGNSRDVRDLVSAAGALGLNISRGWELAGPASCDLLWSGADLPWRVKPAGWIEFGASSADGAASASGAGVALHAPFLNQPIDQIRARAELAPGKQHVALASARAFGAQWTGTFDRTDAAPEWQFALSADHLSAADLDRWLNPLWRESFLDRLLPFLNPNLPAAAVPENLRASGHLALDDFTLPPLVVHHFQGDVKIDGRHIQLANATGQFYGGALTGSLDAGLQAVPSYNANIAFSRVDLAALTAASPELANLFDGSATGKISFSATGATRSDLVASLGCQGQVDFAAPAIRGIDLIASLRAAAATAGASRFSSASASFACASKAIQVQSLSIAVPGPDLAGSGTIDFSRDLDLRLRFVSPGTKTSEPTYRITGSLASPKFARISPARR